VAKNGILKIFSPTLLPYVFALHMVVLGGCAQTGQFTPTPTTVRIELQGLPADMVEVQVNDLRGQMTEADSVGPTLRTEIVRSLSASPGMPVRSKYRLTLDLLEHRSFFTLGNWHASTRLRARLSDPSGSSVGQWDASGSAHRSNTWGYVTAEAVSQDSDNIAVADLLSLLSSVSVR
jgi:hypothetical protein